MPKEGESMEETFYCRRNVELDEIPEDASMDQVVYHFREIMKQRKELAGQKRITGFLCAVSMMLFILSIAISAATMNSYERMKQMETALQSISEGMERALAEPVKKSETEENIPSGEIVNETVPVENLTEKDIEEDVQESKEAVHIMEEPQTESYIVQKGDTLAKISRMFYHTNDMVNEICELNHIRNKDIILCGQELMLP